MSYRLLVGKFNVVDYHGPTDQPYVTDGKRLRPATDEVLQEVAFSAMLLSQGADRAAKLLREAREVAAKRGSKADSEARASHSPRA